MVEAALYLHIPFCLKKCPYCNFYSLSKDPSKEEQKIYLKALNQELSLLKSFLSKILPNDVFLKFITFYAGGGTPSLFSPSFYEDFINLVSNYFDFSPVELTLEANPESLNKTKVIKYRKIGINRLSLGIQSLCKKGLTFLERIHTVDQNFKVLEIVSRDFENFSLDFIFGWKGQGEKTLKKEIEMALFYHPPHFSFYELTLEKGTPFYKKYKGIEKDCKSSSVLKLYRLIEEILTNKGYIRYEISNYAKPGFECKHNLMYWEVKPYIGLGPSAVSRVGYLRWKNPCNLKHYIKTLTEKKTLPLKIIEIFDDLEFAKEYIFMGLRLAKGINLKFLHSHFGFKIKKEILEILQSRSLIKRENENLKLTFKGKLLHNKIVSMLWENLVYDKPKE